MGILKSWFQTSTPIVKMLMAVSITSALVVGNKLYYAPYVKRRRLQRAEEWADTIISAEENQEDDIQ